MEAIIPLACQRIKRPPQDLASGSVPESGAVAAGPCGRPEVCALRSMLFISSRNNVPPWALASLPWRLARAPVKEPVSCPNSSLAMRSRGMAKDKDGDVRVRGGKQAIKHLFHHFGPRQYSVKTHRCIIEGQRVHSPIGRDIAYL